MWRWLRLFSEPYDAITRLETPQNTPTAVKYHMYTRKRKMAEPRKRSRPSRIRHRIETQCETEAKKEALSRRFQRMRELLTPGGAHFADNGVVLNTMFDIVEWEFAGQPTPSSAPPSALSPSMMRNSGETLAVALLYSEKYSANSWKVSRLLVLVA